MTRAYLRLDPAFDEHKESYPDGPYAALIAVFCLAESQPQRGRFRNMTYLRALLGKRGRHLAYLVDHKDVTELKDKRVYVVGWDEWQEGDWKVGERVRRIRGRKDGGGAAAEPDVTPEVTPDATVGVTVPVTPDRLSAGVIDGAGGALAVSAGAGGGGKQPPTNGGSAAPITTVIDYLEKRSGRQYSFGQGSKVHECLSPDVRDFGADVVIAEMAKETMAHPDIAQLVFRASRRLHPVSDPEPAKEPDPAEIARRLEERRAARKAGRSHA